jgi:hypothetical protein
MRLYLNLIREKMRKKQNESYKIVENIEQKRKINKKSYLSYFLCCFSTDNEDITNISQTDSVINMQQNSVSVSGNDKNNDIIKNIILYNQDDFIEQNIYNDEQETKENLHQEIDNKSTNKTDNQEVIDYSFEELKI